MRKYIYVLSVTLAILSLAIASVFSYISPPWKAIDADQRKLDPSQFDFRDYANDKKSEIKQCEAAMKVIRGDMNRVMVESILISSANAKKWQMADNQKTVEYLSPVEGGTILHWFVIPTFYSGLILRINYTDTDMVQDISCVYLMGPTDFALHRRKFF